MSVKHRKNFNPAIWGRNAWNFIHLVALGYPNKPTISDQNKYKSYFKSLGNVLPCQTCRDNYTNHLKKYPIEKYLKSSQTLYTWTVLIRNSVKQHVAISSDTKHDYDPIDGKLLKEHFESLNENVQKQKNYSCLCNLCLMVGTGVASCFVLIFK